MTAKFIGIDTSNYTTSIAVTDLDGFVHFDKRILLNVKPGEIGLRQSDAFYQHVMNLPGIFFEIESSHLKDVAYIAVSDKPRQVEGSYMPVFNAGLQFASVIAKSLDKPLHRVSHQDGHIMASLAPSAVKSLGKVLNLHISGGTTEIFTGLWHEENGYFETEVLGGTLDLSIGQLIDRIGVYMGYGFPCGAAMTKDLEVWLEKNDAKPLHLGLKQVNGQFNLSGIENKLKKLIDEGLHPRPLILYTLFTALGVLLKDALHAVLATCPCNQVILAGGVMSNPWLRQQIETGIKNTQLLFTEPLYCTDNAVGVSKLAGLKYLSELL